MYMFNFYYYYLNFSRWTSEGLLVVWMFPQWKKPTYLELLLLLSIE